MAAGFATIRTCLKSLDCRRVRIPASPPRPKPVVLLILDGWGHREEPADNALAQATLPNWRAPAGRPPAHAGPHRRPPRRPAGRADGQFRSRPHEPRRRPHRLPGPDPHRCGDRGRQLLRQRRTASPPATRPAPAAARCTCSACCRPAACTATRRTSSRCCELARRARRAARRRACVPRRPRHAAALGRGQPARAAGACATTLGNAHIASGRRPLLRDGPRQALGPRARWPGTRSSRPQASTAPPMRWPRCEAAYARGENDEFVRPR